MAQPKKRITRARKKQTYLGSGAGSMRSGTGTTAKKSKSTQIKKAAKEFVPFAFIGAGSPLKAAAKAFGLKPSRPPKSPASGVDSVFENIAQKQLKALQKQRKTGTILRRRAKR